MKSFYVTLVVATCALHEGIAFSTSPPPHPTSMAERRTSLHSATLGSSSSSSSNPRSDAAAKSPRVPTIQEQRNMDTIRGELIEKYIVLGHSEEYADREVTYFLEDSERSAQYVEMRRIAMARGNDLGIEDIVQLTGSFLVGMVGSWALNSLHELQTASADGVLALTS